MTRAALACSSSDSSGSPLRDSDAAALLVLLAAAARARVVAADAGLLPHDRLDLRRRLALRLARGLGHLRSARGGRRAARHRVRGGADVLADAVAAGVLVD